MRYFLNAVYLLLLLATLPYWLWKAATAGKYRTGWRAKFWGAPPELPAGGPVLWVHAVSVGEVLLLRPLFEQLRVERPEWRWALSVTTKAGHELAVKTYPAAAVFFAPLDFSWAVARVLRGLRPRALCLVELELWPNLLLAARRAGVPVLVANARVGERSHRGYRRILPALRPALAAIEWWGAQNEPVAERIRDLTAGLGTTVEVTGSMKYDQAVRDPSNPATSALQQLLGFGADDRVLVGGSTQGREEELLLDAFAELRAEFPGLRLLLVPRHPECFGQVAELLRRSDFDWVRRSEIAGPRDRSAAVTLLDTVGELGAAWGLAEVGYVGGTTACGRGGQSMIEPAGYGVPACFGPEVWNFRDTVDRLLAADGAALAAAPEDLVRILRLWLADPARARAVGGNARRFIVSQQGAVAATAAALKARMGNPAGN